VNSVFRRNKTSAISLTCLRFTENLENQDQTLIKEGTSVNVDNNIEPEIIETREISEIKNNSEPDLHLSTHDLYIT
jgi:hypothetical protein